MKVRLTTQWGEYTAGTPLDLPRVLAQRLVTCDIATSVRDADRAPETATATPAPENASKPTGRKRGGKDSK